MGICAAGYYFSAPECEVPVTGRKYRRLVPTEISTLVESNIAYYIVSEYADSILPANHPYVREITSVGNVLTDANGLPRHEYIVIDKDEVNAFVVGGNIVFVYTGIAPMLANVSGTAMVLGHEMGHVLAGHSSEGLLQGITLMIVAVGVELFGAGHQSITQLWNILFQLPRKRAAELEADEIGYALMSNAGFDRREAVDVYRRMMLGVGEDEEEDDDDFFATHPGWRLRVALLQNLVDLDQRPHSWIRLPETMPINFGTSSLVSLANNDANQADKPVQSAVPPALESTAVSPSSAPSTSTDSFVVSLLKRYGLYALLARSVSARAERAQSVLRSRIASNSTL